jgi:transposase
MEHYVGLDVSLKSTAICVVDAKGKIVREGVVASDPEAIAGFIASYAPDAMRIGLESGATSTWLWTGGPLRITSPAWNHERFQ